MYDPLDKRLSEERLQARLLVKELNDSGDDQFEKLAQIIKALIQDSGKGIWLQPLFYCDFERNILLDDNVFNFNFMVLDQGYTGTGIVRNAG